MLKSDDLIAGFVEKKKNSDYCFGTLVDVPIIWLQHLLAPCSQGLFLLM